MQGFNIYTLSIEQRLFTHRLEDSTKDHRIPSFELSVDTTAGERFYEVDSPSNVAQKNSHYY